MSLWSSLRAPVGIAMVGLFVGGCGKESPPAPEAPPAAAPSATSSSPAAPAASPSPSIPMISLGGAKEGGSGGTGKPSHHASSEQHRRDLLAAMMPLQVMLGTWHGTTQREVGQFKAIDEPVWVWDFQTNRDQPALVMTSSASPYVREARLTYLTDRGLFQMQAIDPEGKTRILEGNFSGPVEEFQGEDQKMHVKYKLELTQVEPAEVRDQWQIIFNQQENNRYLQEMAKKRGSTYLRFDTVATQRQGTSFAKSDAGYGEKECVISGGLGTIQLTHQGKSYWVCCTGCKAAFEEDPESWITEYEKKKASKGS
ncbi:hypothetical protein SH661x_001534 [Planctomicrobium sp. SH661]|uniref:hypothetical protein n=1 Tax=Planctomicrobium sp. SH661 TaxID=3448124 RepID=UPI003F5C4183